jgi:ATPase components of ABC transporters with duplicated ATPase domains
MNLLTVENISKSYSEKILFDNISLGINDGDKIGIIGVNGTGKSTFLKVIAGIEVPDTGNIVKSNKSIIGYLPQNSDFNNSRQSTVIEQIFKSGSPVMELLREYETTIKLIKERPDDVKLQNKLFALNTKIESENAWELESQAKTILTKLGITDFNAKISTLSGGQKKEYPLHLVL